MGPCRQVAVTCPISKAKEGKGGASALVARVLPGLEGCGGRGGGQQVWLGGSLASQKTSHTLTLPPPGWCFRFSVEPIFDLTFFRSGMGTGAVCRRLLLADGDLGGVRTTATFLGSRVGGVGRDGVRERLPGVPGEPGLL